MPGCCATFVTRCEESYVNVTVVVAPAAPATGNTMVEMRPVALLQYRAGGRRRLHDRDDLNDHEPAQRGE